LAVVKTIDLVGVSSESWRDAAGEALAEAAKTLRGIESMDVLETSCTIANSEITEYLAHVRIKFRIDR
jgi:flavin-binding protein dodecin